MDGAFGRIKRRIPCPVARNVQLATAMCAAGHNEMSRRNRRPTSAAEATAAVRSPLAEALGFRSPELMIEIV